MLEKSINVKTLTAIRDSRIMRADEKQLLEFDKIINKGGKYDELSKTYLNDVIFDRMIELLVIHSGLRFCPICNADWMGKMAFGHTLLGCLEHIQKYEKDKNLSLSWFSQKK